MLSPVRSRRYRQAGESNAGLVRSFTATWADADTLTLGATEAQIRKTNSDTANLIHFQVPALNIDITLDTYTHIGIEYVSASETARWFSTTTYSDFDFNTNFPVGSVLVESS